MLPTGNEIRNIHLDYYRGISTVAKIIRVVCNAIWKFCLNANIPKITQQLFEEIAADFDKKANFPNCIGAVDGKHIRIFVFVVPQKVDHFFLITRATIQ